MLIKRVLSTLIIILLLTPTSLSTYASEGGSGSNIINSYNTYYNYYYLNDTEFEYVDLISLNNRDVQAYYRPKYEELGKPLKEHIEFKDKNVKMNKNAFDVDISEINKLDKSTSRALELLGYDYMLFKETVDNTGKNTWYDLDDNGKPDEYHANVQRVIGFDKPITAPYLIMNIYKSLGIDLYDVYFEYKRGTAECGAYITRTNPQSYWDLFLNDHPIDYAVYNDNNIDDVGAGQKLSTADAITILAQMLDFYGEPVISKQEEYLLLQVYGKDVPSTLSDQQKQAWSYLKCRGIIGESELKYDTDITFNDMMDLLMRAKDVGSRTNFKEIQITSSLDNTFVQNGFYEKEVVITSQPSVSPTTSEISWANATRYDFLIEMDNNIAFKFLNSGELNKDIFISKGPEYSSQPIKGSIYEGIVGGRFYHFSVPVIEVEDTLNLYINSSKGGDWPLNYKIPISNQSNRVGGIYSKVNVTASGYVNYDLPTPIIDTFPDSTYVDAHRKNLSSIGVAQAANDPSIKSSYNTDMIDVDKSIAVITKLGGTAVKKIVNGKEELIIEVKLSALGINNINAVSANSIVSRRLVLKDEYITKSEKTKGILGLTGERLLVSLKEAQTIKLIRGYKNIPDKNTLIIYTMDNDIVIVDNKNKVIQKGNTYSQIKEEQALYANIDGDLKVDFRALYGTKEIGFVVGEDVDTKESTIQLYSNSIVNNNKAMPGISRVNEYSYYTTSQYLPYEDQSSAKLSNQDVDLLYKFNPIKVSNNVADEVQEALLPFSSSNAMSNYIIYGEFNANNGLESYHLVTMTPKGIITNKVTPQADYKKMFLYHPNVEVENSYDISVLELSQGTESKYGIKQVPGVGWCYTLKKIENTFHSKKSYLASYRGNSDLLPVAITYDGNVPRLVNFNVNFFTEDMLKNLTIPKDGEKYTPIPAIVGMQSLFTNSAFVPTITKETILDKTSTQNIPTIFFGTMAVSVNDKSLNTKIGNVNVGTYLDMKILGMNKLNGVYKGDNSYLTPGIYSLTSSDLNVSLSTDKDAVINVEVTKREIDLEKFFEQFENITFQDFIKGLDNSMSVLYYIVTRVVPLIILCLLLIILMISMVSDIRIVQLFCERVFDPIELLTFGNYNIQSIRNKHLVLSLIGALTLMGIIQAGNLEKIIMFVIRFFYAFAYFFD